MCIGEDDEGLLGRRIKDIIKSSYIHITLVICINVCVCVCVCLSARIGPEDCTGCGQCERLA